MTARLFITVFLLLNASTLVAQPVSAPPLQAAERALITALTVPDRNAFQQFLSSDTVFFLPVEAHGPEAILQKWSPFLLSRELTLALTIETSSTADSGEIGQTSGTFGIYGRTSKGMTTTPVGAFSIVWRLIDGQWKIGTLSGGSKAAVRLVQRGGVGPYLFGMSKADVSQVADCSPYTNVSRTAGIECANYTFDGRKMNISFLFGADQLKRIQLWFYNGESEQEAREAIGAVIDHLKRVAGGAHIGALPGLEVTTEAIADILKGPVPQGRIAQVEISSPTSSSPEVWFARVARHQLGYMVMLFADPR